MTNDGIRAVAFDIDGTFYSEPLLYLRSLYFGARHRRLIGDFSAIRQTLRDGGSPVPDIRVYQDELFAHRWHISQQSAHDMLDSIIYNEWMERAARMPLFAELRRLFSVCRQRGLRLAILSDFPAHRKLHRWHIEHYFDGVINSEQTGALKPSRAPFERLISALNLPPEQIIYVGNSYHKDIHGAHQINMRSAYFCDPLRLRYPHYIHNSRASHGQMYVFTHYRQLSAYLFTNAR